MNEKKLFQLAANEKMPDIEDVRQRCLNQEVRAHSAKEQRLPWMKRVMPVAACALVVLVAVFAVPHLSNNNAVIDPSVTPNSIYINRLDAIPLGRNLMHFALLQNDFIKMSREELCEYYGANIFPQVPEDLKNWDSSPEYEYGIYRRNNGSGEVYFDQNVINYSNDNFSRNINIETAKGTMPLYDVAAFNGDDFIKSSIGGIEIGIGGTEDGCYYAEFMYKGVGFCIITDGLSQVELISVLESIMK
ncbi:MAG TPA: hypothetical protein DG577_09300 [Firmicutes bacterium]|jgi:hypothetical protein|nr:hypothetical protein [Bacillota bacterium]